jgi:hypothetical protein
MSLMPEGCTPTELAREARMEAKIVRAVLRRLGLAGYVRREQRRKKRTVYIIPESLFRIWHQMNHSRSGRGLVLYLLEFFSTWYESREDRDQVWDEITEKFSESTCIDDDDRRADLSEYLEYNYLINGTKHIHVQGQRNHDGIRHADRNFTDQEGSTAALFMDRCLCRL